MKRILTLILSLALILAAAPAFAERSARTRIELEDAGSELLDGIQQAAEEISGSIPYGGSLTLDGGEASMLCAEAIMHTLDQLRADVEYEGYTMISYEDELYIELWLSDGNLHCSAAVTPASRRSGAANSHRPAAESSIWIDGSRSLYNNIINAADSINDAVIPAGEIFSFNDCVGPRSADCGYAEAVSGSGETEMGGGVEQVASAIWLAVKQMDGVAIVEKNTYGSFYSQSYVSSSNDAIFVDDGRTDFSFRNTGDAPLRISTYVSDDALHCEIFVD